RGAGPSATILNAGGKSRVFLISGSTASVTIDGLTIRDGRSEEETPGEPAEGGGVIDFGANLTMEDDVVTDNHASANGTPGEPGGEAFGGGIEVTEQGTLNLTNTTVGENSANANGGTGEPGGIAKGGGVAVLEKATLHASAVTVGKNIATATGGAGSHGG